MKLSVTGAAYDFGAKFRADTKLLGLLLRRVVEMGFTASLTFHPGTQCHSPKPRARYIRVMADLAREAEVTLYRVNVGGGFGSDRGDGAADLEAIVDSIGRTARAIFDAQTGLVCEPGRALYAEAFHLVLLVKSVEDGVIFVTEGIYGAMAELCNLAAMARHRVVVFGPT